MDIRWGLDLFATKAIYGRKQLTELIFCNCLHIVWMRQLASFVISGSHKNMARVFVITKPILAIGASKETFGKMPRASAKNYITEK